MLRPLHHLLPRQKIAVLFVNLIPVFFLAIFVTVTEEVATAAPFELFCLFWDFHYSFSILSEAVVALCRRWKALFADVYSHRLKV